MADNNEGQSCESTNNQNPPTGGDSVGQRLLEDTNVNRMPTQEQIQSLPPKDMQTGQKSITDLGFPSCSIEDKSKSSGLEQNDREMKAESQDKMKSGNDASDGAQKNGVSDGAHRNDNAADSAQKSPTKPAPGEEVMEDQPSEDPNIPTEDSPGTTSDDGFGGRNSPYVAKKELDRNNSNHSNNQERRDQKTAANENRRPPDQVPPVPDAKGRVIEKPLPTTRPPIPDPDRQGKFHQRHF